MIFNVLQPGQGLGQIDRALPIHADEELAIERGHLLVEDEGAWKVAQPEDHGTATSPGKRLYAALNGSGDADVQFADKLAAISVDTPGYEIETAAFVAGLTLAVGEPLTIGANGRYTNVVANGDTIYGTLNSLPVKRANNNRPNHAVDLFQSVAAVQTNYVANAAVSA